MKYSKGYFDYPPMVERQPQPPSNVLAVLTGLAFSLLFAVMICGWIT